MLQSGGEVEFPLDSKCDTLAVGIEVLPPMLTAVQSEADYEALCDALASIVHRLLGEAAEAKTGYGHKRQLIR